MDGLRQSIKDGKLIEDRYDEIKNYLEETDTRIIVLDDDPTGSQTVYDVPIIAQYSKALLEEFFTSADRILFILTNSRSKSGEYAHRLTRQIKTDAEEITTALKVQLCFVSRSDSTLRGHFKEEVNALMTSTIKCLFVPAFFEGGRYTFRDEHYVQEGDQFLKASETPFAKDASFGYDSSNLMEYIMEKVGASVAVLSISIEEVRSETDATLAAKIDESEAKYIIGNATCYYDLQGLALASLKASSFIIYRSSASFVNALAGIPPRKPLSRDELGLEKERPGLIIVGSYVPKTTAQLTQLKKLENLAFIEMSAEDLMNDQEIDHLSSKADYSLQDGRTAVLYTSREPIIGSDEEESLSIVNKVAEGLVSVVQGIKTMPRYLITKGGITSNDIATEVLAIKKSTVLGQAMPGVPVWKTEHFPFIIFPGNVGDEFALYNLVKQLET